MKFEYKSPVITVEELTKVDVLCESGGSSQSDTTNKYKENIAMDFADIM